MELEDILRAHAVRYPLTQPTDAVKLIYQNEFGGGHLIRSREAALEYLRREYDAVEKNPEMRRYEPIGNGIVRVNLAALEEAELDTIGEAFLASAAEHRGNRDRFCQKLDMLRRLTGEGVFSFGSSELDDYLTEYEAAGFPMVSHSSQYRKAYKPAYRIVLESFL